MNPGRRPRRPRRARFVPVACLVAALPLAGCSDSKKGGGASSPTSTPTSVDTTFTGQGSAEFCQFITTFTEGSQNVSPTASPAELGASFQEALTAVNQAVAVAPTEIKGDVVALADTFETVVTAVSSAGFDLTKVDASALESLQSESFERAVTRLQSYLVEFCGAGG